MSSYVWQWGTYNEEKHDFECLNLAVYIRIELEEIQNEIVRMIKRSEISLKSLCLEKKLDRLLEQNQGQIKLFATVSVVHKGTNKRCARSTTKSINDSCLGYSNP